MERELSRFDNLLEVKYLCVYELFSEQFSYFSMEAEYVFTLLSMEVH